MYQLIENSTGVLRSGRAYIPNDPANRDWVEYQKWLAAGNTPEPVPAPAPTTPEQVQAGYVAALDNYLDTVARTRGYDSRTTCALRAGYPGPFRAEGEAFAVWMDTCYAIGLTTLNDVSTGKRQMPSPEQFVADLPALVWPK